MIDKDEFIPFLEFYSLFKRRSGIFVITLILPVLFSTIWSFTTNKKYLAIALLKYDSAPARLFPTPFIIKEILKHPDFQVLISKKSNDNISNLEDCLKIRTNFLGKTVEIIGFGGNPEKAIRRADATLEALLDIQEKMASLSLYKSKSENEYSKKILTPFMVLHFPRTARERNHKLDITVGVLMGIIFSTMSVIISDSIIKK